MTATESGELTVEPDDIAPTSPRSPKQLAITVIAVVAVIAAGVLLVRVVADRLSPHLYSGTVLQSSTPAPALDALTFASGEPVDLGAFGGDVVLLYFGYTNCPDVCPLTLSTAARARADLSPADQERTSLLMVSVDPARDDLESLQSYVAFFDPVFSGVGGDPDKIDRVAAEYGVFYELGEGTPETGYTVDHTASLLAIGPDGGLRVVWPPDVTAEQIQADIAELLS